VSDPRAAAARYGLRVEIGDLGVWEPGLLIAEYDRRAQAIRVNARAIAAVERWCGGDANAIDRFIGHAVAHELYHHREAIGEIATLPTRAAREAAASAAAHAQAPLDAHLVAFVRAQAR
jgi:hypothetical protein